MMHFKTMKIVLFTHSFAKFALNVFYIQGTLLGAQHYGEINDSSRAWNKPRSAVLATAKWSTVKERFHRGKEMAVSSVIMACSYFPKGGIKLMGFKQSQR